MITTSSAPETPNTAAAGNVIASRPPSASVAAPTETPTAAIQNPARRPVRRMTRSPAIPTAIAPTATSVVCRLTTPRETSSCRRSVGSAGPSA